MKEVTGRGEPSSREEKGKDESATRPVYMRKDRERRRQFSVKKEFKTVKDSRQERHRDDPT